ncbi:hypothetical protein MRX96_041824 [Rhipicephalus microplus]
MGSYLNASAAPHTSAIAGDVAAPNWLARGAKTRSPRKRQSHAISDNGRLPIEREPATRTDSSTLVSLVRRNGVCDKVAWTV